MYFDYFHAFWMLNAQIFSTIDRKNVYVQFSIFLILIYSNDRRNRKKTILTDTQKDVSNSFVVVYFHCLRITLLNMLILVNFWFSFILFIFFFYWKLFNKKQFDCVRVVATIEMIDELKILNWLTIFPLHT